MITRFSRFTFSTSRTTIEVDADRVAPSDGQVSMYASARSEYRTKRSRGRAKRTMGSLLSMSSSTDPVGRRLDKSPRLVLVGSWGLGVHWDLGVGIRDFRPLRAVVPALSEPM